MSDVPRAPNGTQAAGRRLWRSALETFELDEHELTLLRQAVAVADLCDALQGEVDRSGLLVGDRTNPALAELRQQRILLARLVVALRVPIGDAEDEGAGRSQRRGLHGVYGIRGGGFVRRREPTFPGPAPGRVRGRRLAGRDGAAVVPGVVRGASGVG